MEVFLPNAHEENIIRASRNLFNNTEDRGDLVRLFSQASAAVRLHDK
jgi:hypothetical protein